ncbi:MAG: tryptophan-rich sensory protein [Anaerolineales bacterium]|nr:MAG: tryptophan-rich sensory protein [Anaerolineales bacterium]
MNRRIVSVVLTLLTITVNAMANILPINGQTTGEISDRFAIRFVPAGYVFSIWGLIYVGLIAFAVYQALPAQRGNKLLDQIAPAYWIASLANAAWIVLWHYEQFTLTIIVIVVLLLSLISIYRSIRTAKQDAGFLWCVQIPFSIYLGWASVATIANASQVLTFLGWGAWGLSAELWAVIMLVTASLLGAAMLLRERDAAYALVLVWAFVGIALKQADSALVANAAWALATVLALGSVWSTVRK